MTWNRVFSKFLKVFALVSNEHLGTERCINISPGLQAVSFIYRLTIVWSGAMWNFEIHVFACIYCKLNICPEITNLFLDPSMSINNFRTLPCWNWFISRLISHDLSLWPKKFGNNSHFQRIKICRLTSELVI